MPLPLLPSQIYLWFDYQSQLLTIVIDPFSFAFSQTACIAIKSVIQGVLIKRKAGLIFLKLDKHFSKFGYYLLEGYLFFPKLPRNVGSVKSVNESEHFKNRLTTWLCTKMFRLRVVPSLWYLRPFFQIVDFTGTGRPQNRRANLFPTSCKLPVWYHSVTVKTLLSFVSYVMKCTGTVG